MKPLISFIVSAFNRPLRLRCVLASLQVQSEPNIEIIVADNSTDPDVRNQHAKILGEIAKDENPERDRFSIVTPGESDCYRGALHAAQFANADWLCFPHDDDYYVPDFAHRMLASLDRNPLAQFIFCDMLYDARLMGEYAFIYTSPRIGKIDKAGFLIRRELFLKEGVTWLENDSGLRDGMLVERLVKLETKMVKVPAVLWVHN